MKPCSLWRALAGALAFAFAPSVSAAMLDQSAFIPPGAFETGTSLIPRTADRAFQFDAAAGVLSGSASGRFESQYRDANALGTPASKFFTASFTWSVAVTSDGRVSEPGVASFLATADDGAQYAATGKVADIGAWGGSSAYTCGGEPLTCTWRTPEVSIRLDEFDPLLEDVVGGPLGNWWLWRGYMFVSTQGDNVFGSSFVCGVSAYCPNFSNDTIFAYRVPEPSSMALLAAGLVVLATVRRRRTERGRLLTAAQSKPRLVLPRIRLCGRWD